MPCWDLLKTTAYNGINAYSIEERNSVLGFQVYKQTYLGQENVFVPLIDPENFLFTFASFLKNDFLILAEGQKEKVWLVTIHSLRTTQGIATAITELLLFR